MPRPRRTRKPSTAHDPGRGAAKPTWREIVLLAWAVAVTAAFMVQGSTADILLVAVASALGGGD